MREGLRAAAALMAFSTSALLFGDVSPPKLRLSYVLVWLRGASTPALPPAPRPVEYWHVINTSAPMTHDRALRALVGLVMGGAVHAFCHPERPGVPAGAAGTLGGQRARLWRDPLARAA